MGLLNDLYGTPDKAQALGLLGAMMMRGRTAEGLGAATQFMGQADERATRKGLLDAQLQETLAQAQQRQEMVRQAQAAAQEKARVDALIANAGKPAPGMGATGAVNDALPPQFRIGAQPQLSAPRIDYQDLIRQGVPYERLKQLADATNLGRAEVARTVKGIGPDGREYEYQTDKFGQRVGDGLAQYKAPHYQDLGGTVGVFDGYGRSTGSLPKSMTAEGRDASARGWAGHNLAQQRFNLESGNLVADAGGTNQMALQKKFGKPEPGFRWKDDGTAEAIPGGSKDIKAGEAGAKAEQRRAGALQGAENVLREIKDAKELVGVSTAGFGGVLRNVPATNARNLSAKLETIKANLGFDRLQQMRDQSPTGGALGAVAVQELVALQSTVASLDQLQSPAQVSAALDKIEKHYSRWADTVRQAGNPQGGASGGWSIQKVN